MDDTYICAEIVSSQDEQNPVPVGAIQPVPVTTLLSGQKMSLPTVNQGNYIYCIDGWFEVFRERNGAQVAAMTPTKYPGKSQLHLRMTFIPSNGIFISPFPLARSEHLRTFNEAWHQKLSLENVIQALQIISLRALIGIVRARRTDFSATCGGGPTYARSHCRGEVGITCPAISAPFANPSSSPRGCSRSSASLASSSGCCSSSARAPAGPSASICARTNAATGERRASRCRHCTLSRECRWHAPYRRTGPWRPRSRGRANPAW